MLKEFKQYILRGNVVDLAVGVVMGVAFGAVVASLVGDLLTPLIAAVVGKHDFSKLHFAINKSVFRYGAFINAVIAFVTVAAALFFFVVRPINALMATRKIEPPVRDCPQCLSSIPTRATRCAFCTAEVTPTAA